MARASDPVRARLVATAIVRRLREAGHTAYFAGGCVRDALLGLSPTDFDIATDAPPGRVRELFPHSAEVGASFGVILVHERGGNGGGGVVSVEVATFRSDGTYSNARHPDSVRFSDPPSDAQRRDFTINALFFDPLASAGTDAVIDYVGGRADLAARLIRAVGDPHLRLQEDHLRALRAVRFAARLGFELEPGTGEAIRRHAAELRGVSRERIGEEVRRMLAHPGRVRAIELLNALGLDAPVLNEPALGSAQAPLPKPPPASIVGGLPDAAEVSTVLAGWALDRFRTLAHGHIWPDEAWGRATAARWRSALCLSNEEHEHLSGALSLLFTLTTAWAGGELSIARKKRTANRGAFGPALTLLTPIDPDLAAAIGVEVGSLESDGIGLGPPPVVTGDTLIRGGWKPGPGFKGVLDGVYDAQLEGRVRTEAEGMELAARLSV